MHRTRFPLLNMLSVALTLILAGAPAFAATLTWDADTVAGGAQDGAGSWNTVAADWWNGAADQAWPNTTSDDAIFGAGSGAAGTVAVGSVTANSITFNSAGSGNYVLSGGTITLRGQLGWSNVPNVTVNSDAAINSNVAMTLANGLVLGGAGKLTFGGSVSYNGGLGLANTSTLSIVPGGSVSLTGTVGNQVVFASTGTTLSVDGGSFSSTGNTGPSAGRFSNLAVNSGTFSASSAENNASRFYGINLLGANSSLTLNGGTTSVQGISTDGNVSTIRFNGGTLRVLAQPPVSAAGTFLPATGNLTALVQAGGAILDTNGQNAAISQALIHDPALGATPDGGLLKTGAGTLTLSGANTYTGGTIVRAGTLQLGNTAAAGAGAVTLGDAGTGASNVQLTLGAANIANAVTVSNLGTGTATLLGTGQYQSYLGALTVNRPTILEIPNTGTGADWWFGFGSGGITGTGPLIIKGGAGGNTAADAGNRVALGGTNSYSGGTVVESGKLQITSAGAAGSGPITLGNANTGSAVTQLRVGANIPNAIVISSAAPGSAAGIGSWLGLLTLSGGLQVDRPVTLYGGSDRVTWSGAGAVWSGSADITVSGGRVTHDGTANTWTGDMTINGGSTFQPGHASTLSAANSLTVNGTLQLNNVPQTIDGLSGAGVVKNIVGGNTLTVGAGGATSTFSGTTQNGSGTLSLIKAGAGTLTLAGTTSHTGNTTVNEGTLVKAGPGALYLNTLAPGATYIAGADTTYANTGGGIRGAVQINSGATFRNTTAHIFDTTSSRIWINGGTLTHGPASYPEFYVPHGASASDPGVQMTGGEWGGSSPHESRFASGVTAYIRINAASTTATIADSTLSYQGGTQIYDVVGGTVPSGVDLDFTGGLARSFGGGTTYVIKNGAGLMRVSGTSSTGYALGGMTVNGGVLELMNNGNGSGDGWRSNITLANDSAVWLTATSGQSSDLRANISGDGSVVKKDAGVVRLGPWGGVTQLTQSGDVTVEAGSLDSAGRSNYQMFDTPGDLVIAGGANFNYSALNDFSAGTASRFGALRGEGTVTTSYGTHYIQFGNADKSGEFLGDVTGALHVTKIGEGTQTFSGANAYSGTTTVAAGALLVNGTHTGGGTYTVNGGATLGGSGDLGAGSAWSAVSVQTGGHLAPGANVGSLGVGTATLPIDSFFDVDLDPVAWDTLEVHGQVNLNTPTLNLSVLSSFSHYGGGQYVIIDNDGTEAIAGSGMFADLPEGSSIEVNGNQFILTYQGGTGNDVVLTAVPEPVTLSLLMLASAGLAGYARRRSRR
ncbi:MAG: Autotransporter-associated beta strand repeat protein [Planctomycetes bacterium ADurb.Bin126]|nr:MAG: Autotransporter-associated beta strand repeat protein [Planctomycetes bacterium ADurb.Bin126]HOD81997.1 autotransporter-associated beta strand repeat-containing protein [Phycisphaerae bacterium]HQL74255.1 autotransporter-associated beta strand repeat-containing protein [Phycisphaerae bacterium]